MSMINNVVKQAVTQLKKIVDQIGDLSKKKADKIDGLVHAKEFGASGSNQTTTGSVDISNPKKLTVTDIKDFDIGQGILIPKAKEDSYKIWKAELVGDPTNSGDMSITLDGAAAVTFPVTISYETVTVTFTSGVTGSTGTFILYLDDSPFTFPLSALSNTTSDTVATSIIGWGDGYWGGWTATKTGPSQITFTALRQGKKGGHWIDANGTGVTATIGATKGSGSKEDIMKTIRNTSFPGWVTGGAGGAVIFTSTTLGNRNGAFSFNRGTTGASGMSQVLSEGIKPLVTKITDIKGNEITIRDSVLRTVSNQTIFHDDTEALQSATEYINGKGGGEVKITGTPNISSTITTYEKIKYTGHTPKTTIVRAITYNIRMFEALGDFLNTGSKNITDLMFVNITLDGNDLARQALYVKGGRNLRIDTARFMNCWEEFVYFDEVFDSTIHKTYFINGFRPSDKPLVMFNYGQTDNTNQIHMNDCVWETFVRPGLRMQSGTGAENKINEIYFSNCKMESIYPANHIEIFGGVNIFFTNHNQALPRSTSSKKFYGVYAEDSRNLFFSNLCVEYFEIGENIPYGEFPYMGVKNTKFINLINAKIEGIWPPAAIENLNGSDFLWTYGAVINQDPTRVLTRGNQMQQNTFTSNIRITKQGEEPAFEVRRTSSSGESWMYYLGRIDSTGNFRVMDGNSVESLRITTGGEIQSKKGLSTSDKWDSGNLLRLGNYRLWIDSTGKLRIKNGVPTSETDGTIVGT